MLNASRRLSAGTGAQEHPTDLQEKEGQALPLAELARYTTASLGFNSGPAAKSRPDLYAPCDVYVWTLCFILQQVMDRFWGPQPCPDVINSEYQKIHHRWCTTHTLHSPVCSHSVVLCTPG